MYHQDISITVESSLHAQRVLRAVRDAGVPAQVWFTGVVTDADGIEHKAVGAPVRAFGNTRRIEIAVRGQVVSGHYVGTFTVYHRTQRSRHPLE